MEPSEQGRKTAGTKRCAQCGREGSRGFMVIAGRWICQSSAACERMVRGTAQVGVGAMRSYVR